MYFWKIKAKRAVSGTVARTHVAAYSSRKTFDIEGPPSRLISSEHTPPPYPYISSTCRNSSHRSTVPGFLLLSPYCDLAGTCPATPGATSSVIRNSCCRFPKCRWRLRRQSSPSSTLMLSVFRRNHFALVVVFVAMSEAKVFTAASTGHLSKFFHGWVGGWVCPKGVGINVEGLETRQNRTGCDCLDMRGPSFYFCYCCAK